MLFCPFSKNLDGRLLDNYTLDYAPFLRVGKLPKKFPKYRYYFLYIDIGFFSNTATAYYLAWHLMSFLPVLLGFTEPGAKQTRKLNVLKTLINVINIWLFHAPLTNYMFAIFRILA